MVSDKSYATEARLNALIASLPQYAIPSSAPVTVNSAGFNAIPGMSAAVGIGTYLLRGQVIAGSVTAGDTGSAGIFGVTSVITVMRIAWTGCAIVPGGGANTPTDASEQTSLGAGGAFSDTVFGTADRQWSFAGIAGFSTGGSVNISCAMSAGSFSVMAGSFLECTPVPIT